MAIVKITPDINGAWRQKGKQNTWVLPNGTWYCLVQQRMYKWNTGTSSWDEKDTANKPGPQDLDDMSACLDANGVVWVIYNDTATTVDCIPFYTEIVAAPNGPDLWGATEKIADITAINNGYASNCIEVDASNFPHCTFGDLVATKRTLKYSNRITGGAWKAAVAVSANSVYHSNLLIESSGKPIIIYHDNDANTTMALRADANDATAWSDSQAVGSVDQNCVDAVIDGDGDIWIAKAGLPSAAGTALTLIQHRVEDNWATWQAEITIDATTRNTHPSMAAKGTELHILAAETAEGLTTMAGIIYHTNASGSWVTTAAAGDLAGNKRAPKCRWSYRNNPSYNTYPLHYTFDNADDAEQYSNSIDISSAVYKGFLFPRSW